MSKKLPEAGVNRDHVGDAETWSFECLGVLDDECGPFKSSGWPTKRIAQERGRQHLDEHELGKAIREAVQAAEAEADDPDTVDRAAVAAKVIRESDYHVMPELDEFRDEHGLVAHDDGLRAVQGD